MLLRSSCEEASGFSYTFGGFWWTTVGAGSGDIPSSDGEVHDTWSGVYWTGEPEAGSWSGPGRLEIMAVGLIMASREKRPSSKGMGHFSMPAIEKDGASPDGILVVGRWQNFSPGRSAMLELDIGVADRLLVRLSGSFGKTRRSFLRQVLLQATFASSLERIEWRLRPCFTGRFRCSVGTPADADVHSPRRFLTPKSK